jgi:hypothetical protein
MTAGVARPAMGRLGSPAWAATFVAAPSVSDHAMTALARSA